MLYQSLALCVNNVKNLITIMYRAGFCCVLDDLNFDTAFTMLQFWLQPLVLDKFGTAYYALSGR